MALERAEKHRVVNSLQWLVVPQYDNNTESKDKKTLVAYAQGPAEAASHVETTLTQCIEELVIAAQVGFDDRKQPVFFNALLRLIKTKHQNKTPTGGANQSNSQRHNLSRTTTSKCTCKTSFRRASTQHKLTLQ